MFVFSLERNLDFWYFGIFFGRFFYNLIFSIRKMSANTKNVFKILLVIALASATMAAIPPTTEGDATVVPGTHVTHHHEHHEHHEHTSTGTSAGDYDFKNDKFF